MTAPQPPTVPALVGLPDGRVLDLATPVLRADDGGAARGDGCFETMLLADGQVRDLDDHLARWHAAADLLDLPVPTDDRVRRVLAALLDRLPATGEAVVRLRAARPAAGESEGWHVTVAPVPATTLRQRRDGVRVLLLDSGQDPEITADRAPWLLLSAKTLSYAVNMAAVRHAQRHDADDAILLAGGRVLDGAQASVVVATADGTLVSPPTGAILDGITVRRLFDAAAAEGRAVQRRPVEIAELHDAVGVWLLSSVRLVAEVTAIDGVPRPKSPLTADVSRLLQVPIG